MSLFGSLYVGTSGLQTSQNALNTTAHNMSNVDTVGYTRQQIQLGTRSYNILSVNASAISYQQTGLGVLYSQTKQVRDQFLDKIYRKESGRSAFYETNTQVIEEMEDLFGEFQGVEFSEALENLWTAIEELDKDPLKLTNQNLFVTRSAEFLQRAGLIYQGLCDQQDNLNIQVKNNINTINNYGQQLVDINKQILKIESGNIEKANDLRDRRNQILDELSKMGNMSYEEDMYGIVTVKFEGVDFVRSDSVNKLELYEDKSTGFYTPYWSQLATYKPNAYGEMTLDLEAARLYDPTQIISSDLNTDIGSMRAILLARGEKRATYHDVQDADHYNTNISQSLLMNIQAEFDQLVNKITTIINDVLKEAALSEPDSDYMKDENGNPYKLFEVISPDGAVGFTIGNIVINEALVADPAKLSFRLADGKEDKETTGKLIKAFSEETHTLNPNLKTTTNLMKYYSSLISQISNTGEANKAIAAAQVNTVNEAFSAREQIVGVSSDEEMEFMIKFQNAYNASSRYINVINEMMEHILNTLGR
ncbi:flagellar hook-associated protein FlgK [Kineothrix sp. MB12-C1]|uniref:flagellar hook-associated protein FlgK n=1 Tax=Kineothrix sp. MB12-C1 TaxID=3070215 RepID=UPI0027D2BDB5|nr:flagellar hook-associated protein FlgK [Kineothrix sp. MB12-C1]WMC93894.1 flagellar hook-associated protein FlgK [Kineothrix sp. MB12-C1]